MVTEPTEDPVADLVHAIGELTYAVMRVEALCNRWDALSKGESETTRQIREAIGPEILQGRLRRAQDSG